MFRKKLVRGVAVCLIVMSLAGLFYYMFYLNGQNSEQRGTLVNTFLTRNDEVLV